MEESGTGIGAEISTRGTGNRLDHNSLTPSLTVGERRRPRLTPVTIGPHRDLVNPVTYSAAPTMKSVFSASTLRLAVLITSVLTAGLGSRGVAQSASPTTTLTLADAWSKAEAKSDQLIIAAARKDHARGGAHESGSLRRPRVTAFSAYDRTLRSEFEGVMGFEADSASPPSDDSAEIPFGSAHTYRAGLTASYMVFSGGRSLAMSR